MSDSFTPLLVENGSDGARAEVRRHGAHVTSWMVDGAEQLYLSGRSALRDGAAIRGGVPIIFPQFSTFGPLPRHGFARTRAWDADGPGRFRLRDDDATRAIWPHAFVATYAVDVADRVLRLALTIENTGPAPFEFTAALHTYLRVAELADVAIDGLASVRYRDQTAGGAERVDEAPLRFAGEVDRIYLDVPGAVRLRDAARTVHVSAEGFPDVVVWNPGASLAETIADLDPDGWRRFVCIEAAAIARPVRLAPNASWTGRQVLVLGSAGDGGGDERRAF
jgi:glucose-6-phosphate 1-epimerase